MAQRKIIDSLKLRLSDLTLEQRADCLNNLSLTYTYLDPDTAQAYEAKALDYARQIHYSRGEITAINNEARIAGYARRNFPLQEKICRQIIVLYKEVIDPPSLSETHLNLALALFNQGMFDLARTSCISVIDISKKIKGGKQRMGEAIALLGSISFELGDYQRAFQYYNESLKIFNGIKDSYDIAVVLTKIGDLHQLAGDDKAASALYYQSLKYKQSASLIWHPLVDLGDTYYSAIPIDSALYHNDTLQAIKSLTINTNNIAFQRIREADKLTTQLKYKEALFILKDELSNAYTRNDVNYVMRLLLMIASVEGKTGDIKNSLSYTRKLIQTGQQHQAKLYLQYGYQLMYRIFDQMHTPDSAYSYYKRYTELKNTVALVAFGKNLAIYKALTENEKAKAQIELIASSKQINDQNLIIKEQELAKGSLRNKILVGLVVLLLGLGFVLFKNSSLRQKNHEQERDLLQQTVNVEKLESEKIKRDLQQQALQLEMKALRAQMNPHFIFNSLNSINHFILTNNKNLASDYLTKFSRLMRMILQNSQYTSITLEQELESLNLYLSLESVRFDHHFGFVINVHEDVDSAVKLPPLILQPYVENAIWHGLMHKEEKGLLKIDISEDGSFLNCEISDNGIGRKKSSEIKNLTTNQHRSMGMKISADRIALLHRDNDARNLVVTTDLILADGSPGGTQVNLKIPIRYD